MPELSFACVRSLAAVLVVLLGFAMTVMISAHVAEASALHGLPLRGASADVDGLSSALAWLADEVRALIMRIQDAFEGWTWA